MKNQVVQTGATKGSDTAKPVKHSPRPWFDEKESPTYRNRVHSINISRDGGSEKVATCYGRTLDEARANAKIMALAPELLRALQMMSDHYDDIGKSNPGWIGKLVLQDYELWNKALFTMEQMLAKATTV